MIDRYLLRYFLAVVDRGTFSRAAAQVNVAQPTLSIGIAKLERLLGSPLFQRNSQRVNLTDAGARLVVHARRIESEFNLAEAAVGAIRSTRTIRLGVLSTIPTSSLTGFVRRFAETGASSGERIELIEGGERDLLQRLSRGRLDLALTLLREEPGTHRQETLYSEGYSLAVPLSHPLAAEETVAAEALGDNTMIVRLQCEVLSETSRHFTERGVRPFFALRSSNDDRVVAMVEAGLGITVMPDSYRSPGIRRPRLAGFTRERRIGLIYANQSKTPLHADSPLLQSLRASFSGHELPSRG